VADRIPLSPDHRHGLVVVQSGELDEQNELSPAVVRALSDAGLIERARGCDPWRLTRLGQARLAHDAAETHVSFGRGGTQPTRPSRRRWRR
jgi:hypothetical protein